ncbi:Prominin-1-A [Bagarius yarrelli]|uniref:Prominin-1-A n=1 Tax=Bagarius yarrelli TaxID=175774 RepID=A0A556UFZ0_BAGYA|nr:Prominin-1-A [Bagarius yarrelli]
MWQKSILSSPLSLMKMMMMMVVVMMCCWSFVSGAARKDPVDVHGDALDFGFVPAVVYETHATYEPGAVDLLFHIVHAFLHIVQPNPFPAELIVKILQQNMRGLKPEELQKAVYYELGFIVLALLGVVFVLLMPLVGLFFCLCRCCDNCGGEMHQRNRKNADCQRCFYALSLVISSVFMALGVLVAYTGSHNITSQIRSTKRLVNSNINDLKSLAGYTPTQIEYLTAQYTTAKTKVLSDLDTMRETKEALENVSTSLETLQEATSKLQKSLLLERSSLSVTLNDPACNIGNALHMCNSIRSTLAQLAVGADFNVLPDVSVQLINLKTLMETDLSYIVQKGYSAFNDTSRIVSEQTQGIMTKVKALLDKSGEEIIAFTSMFPVESALKNFTLFLTEREKDIERLYPQIEQFDFYRWIGCVVLCCMVVLILAFNLLGLMCGMCGHDKNATPTTRGCLSNTGGNLLMAGVGFGFFFSWVLMGVVVTTFVTGGNVEKLVCEPLTNRQIFKIIDTPYMVHPGKRNFLPGMLFQNPNIDLTIGSLYSDCSINSGIYSALQLENRFHFIQFINRTVNNHDLSEILNGIQVDLKGIILLDEEGKDTLINFANSGLGEINYDAFLSEVNKGVTVIDLLSFANELEAEADHLPRGALGNALKGHAGSIRQLHKEQVLPMEQAMSSLSRSVRLLQTTAEELPSTVTNVLSAIDAAEYLISNNASHVVKKETEKFSGRLTGYLKQYVDWVHISLMMEVAPCKPISNIIDSLKIIGCSFIVDSVVRRTTTLRLSYRADMHTCI